MVTWWYYSELTKSKGAQFVYLFRRMFCLFQPYHELVTGHKECHLKYFAFGYFSPAHPLLLRRRNVHLYLHSHMRTVLSLCLQHELVRALRTPARQDESDCRKIVARLVREFEGPEGWSRNDFPRSSFPISPSRDKSPGHITRGLDIWNCEMQAPREQSMP